MGYGFEGIDREKVAVLEGQSASAFGDIDSAKWGLIELKGVIDRFEGGLTPDEYAGCADELSAMAMHVEIALASVKVAWETFDNFMPC